MAGPHIAVRVRDLSAVVVLVLVAKNAAWAVMTGHFANPPPLPSIFWWYALCALHLWLTAGPLHRHSLRGERLATGAAWSGCAAALVLAWLSLPEGQELRGEPVASWYDFVPLAVAFLCAGARREAPRGR